MDSRMKWASGPDSGVLRDPLSVRTPPSGRGGHVPDTIADRFTLSPDNLRTQSRTSPEGGPSPWFRTLFRTRWMAPLLPVLPWVVLFAVLVVLR